MQQAESLSQVKLASINLLQSVLYAESTSQFNSQNIANFLIFYIIKLSICHEYFSDFYYHFILHSSAHCCSCCYSTVYIIDHSLLLCNLSSICSMKNDTAAKL